MKRFPGWPMLGAAFGLGAVMAAGQAPLGFWWMTLAGLAGVTSLVAQADRGRAAWLGWFAGAGYFALALSWIIEPFLIDLARHGWMAPFAIVLISFGLALFWAAAAALGAGSALGFALALTAAEFLRGHVLTGFPWALVGHVWAGWAPAQLAAWVGPVGLTLMTALVAAAPVALRWRGAVVSAAVVAGAFALGQWRLDAPEPQPTGKVVRLVQPNADQHLKWQPGMARHFFDVAIEQTVAEGSPDLVVWPETAVPWLLNDDGGALAYISEAAGGVPVAVGIQRTEGPRGWNSLAVIGQGGAVGQVYDKHHLVPFGEYIPFGDTMAKIGITAFASQLGSGYSAGEGAKVLDLGAMGKALPLICYEAVFPQDVAAAPERADWMLQITNDAWFGKLTGPYQHLAQARLRAIEFGLPLLRAANTGVSAVVDAKGRVVATLPLGVAGHLDAALPAHLPPTFYARNGDWPVLACLLALAFALIGLRRRKRP